MVVALERKKDWVIVFKILSQSEIYRSEVNPITTVAITEG
jgi:hypothetical protein